MPNVENKVLISSPTWSVSARAKRKAETIREWLKKSAPGCCTEQRHLDEGTTERIYWHYGYLCALDDVLKLMSKTN